MSPDNLDSAQQSSTTQASSFIISVLIFQQTLGALAFPISKYGLAYIEPFTFAFYRFVIASILLLAVVKFRKKSIKIEKQDYLKIIGLGILIIPLNQLLFLTGQSFTTASHGALLFATTPIWILITAIIHLKERPKFKRILGIILALSGVGVVMTSGALHLGTDYLFGDLLILIAVVAWAYYTVLGKTLVQKYGAIRVTAYALSFGSLLYMPFGIYQASKFEYTAVPLDAWGSVLYMAIGTSVVAYVIWYWVLKYLEASRIALFHNVQPFIAALVAYIWLGEPISTALVVGGLIAITGILIAEK